MKKIVFATALAITLAACKKESVTTSTPATQDSVTVADAPAETPPANFAALAEVSPDQASQLLKQSNDTLYVTNFFATWCGPCMKEIPYFKEKMETLKGQPVKFTFISLDDKSDWEGAVKDFASEQGLAENITLLDGNQLTPDWFAANFKTWKGEAIPFTFMKKGDKTDEHMGAMSREMLDEKINSFK